MGDPLAADTKIGAMISEAEAARVARWVDEAVASGAASSSVVNGTVPSSSPPSSPT